MSWNFIPFQIFCLASPHDLNLPSLQNFRKKTLEGLLNMHKWLLFLLIIILKEVLLYESTEFYSYDLIKNSITKFSPERIFIEREKDKIYQFDLEIMLPAPERKFHLLMYEDVMFRESFLLSNGSDARFYEGIVKGDPSSSVLGFVHNGVFSGSIKTSNKTYFVEPAHSLLDNIEDTQLSVLYSNYDIKYPKNICKNIHSNLSSLDTDVKEFNNDAEAQQTLVLDGLTCRIEVVADHTLYNYFKQDENKVLAYLYLHSKYTDFVFRNTDFDRDGKADNLRIVPVATHIYKSTSDSNYPMKKSRGMYRYLIAFGERENQYCLMVSIMHRPFRGTTIGMAHTPGVVKSMRTRKMVATSGGVCDGQRTENNKRVWKNCVIVNTLSRKKLQGLGVSLLTAAHEVGHAFGSNDDPVKNTDCLPDVTINYVMAPLSYTVKIPWIETFSVCSIRSIYKLLHFRSGCLIATNPICGNGLRDRGEECDCGAGEIMCDKLDRCCTPAGVPPPEKGCTIRSSRGYVCSAIEECCDDTCQLASGKPCLYMVNHCYPNVCDGKQTVCPKPAERSHRKECEGMDQNCLGGICENTICRKVGYLNCICNDTLTKDCSVCCAINGTCQPASEIGLRSIGGTNISLPQGTPCMDGLHTCGDDGKCFIITRISCSSILKSGVLYWFITFIMFSLRRLLSVV